MTCPECKHEFTPKKRGPQANKYYFGIVIPAFQSIWSRGRIALNLPPYSKDETNDVLCQALYPCTAGPVIKGVQTMERRHTSDMDSRQFNTHVELCRSLAWDEYRSRIPLPNEVDWEEVA